MTQGIVTGGWSFVIAAYALTATAFLIYGITLLVRLREERNRAEDGGNRE
jgi:hypothetical protein